MFDHTENENRLKRLKYRANHRGVKEMDIILGQFADNHLDKLDATQIDAFEALMGEHDQDLLAWFTGQAELPHNDLFPIFELIKNQLEADKAD